MTTEQTARAYQQFTGALAAWWNNPGRHAFRKPELADFTSAPAPEPAPADPLEESPDSERAARGKKAPKNPQS